jgi:formimidoylglutamate deiminase
VQWLLDNFAVDRQWCLIHCTHMTPDETYRLAASGAVAGLCPTTEVNLGDGIFRASVYLANGGIYGVGTDSNIQIDAAAFTPMGIRLAPVFHKTRIFEFKSSQSSGRKLISVLFRLLTHPALFCRRGRARRGAGDANDLNR